jgi:uncharacterized protein YecT (DUF1311 family)
MAPAESLAQTQADMNQDACGEFKKSDAQLNQAYKKILAARASDKVFVQKFKSAQRAWIAFRDAELKALYPSDQPGFYGSSLPMCQCAVLARLTDDRARQLQGWLTGHEGDVCAGSQGP